MASRFDKKPFMRIACFVFILSFVPVKTSAQHQLPKHLFREFNTTSAMEALFGNFDPFDGYSKWQPGKSLHDVYYARIVLDAPYVESGAERHLLIAASLPESDPPYNCHACLSLISAAVFSRKGDGWQLSARDLYVARAGEFGNYPRAELQQLGPNHFGFRLEESHTGGGVGTLFSIFAVSGPRITNVLSGVKDSSFLLESCAKLSMADAWESCAEYTGGISVSPGPDQEYFDILIARRVISSLTRRIPRGLYLLRYQFQAGKYVLKQQVRR